MNTITKILVSAITVAAYVAALRLLAPDAQLASNHVIVQQMDGSNASALAAHYVGSGSWFPAALLTVITLVVLAVIWVRQSR